MTQVELSISLTVPGAAAGKEWMVVNGLSGYASGTLDGRADRRHDGLLVAALPSPFGRTILLDRLDEVVTGAEGGSFRLFESLVEFRLECGLPVWLFRRGGLVMERRVVMPYGQNTTLIRYALLEGDPVGLDLRPWMHVRGNDGQADQPLHRPTLTQEGAGRIEITQGPYPPLRLSLLGKGGLGEGGRLILDGGRTEDSFYPIEAERDYVKSGPVWSPGVLSIVLDEAGVALLASAEPWPVALALDSDQALAAERERRRRLLARAHPSLETGMAPLLVYAADAFLFDPRGRHDLVARAHAVGDQVRSVIAGYPWFNDWGRDTMISLEGLTLLTGRADEAKWILRTFASYERDGLIPNNIPDGGTDGVYHAADATLWFFHALDRYLTATGDDETLGVLMPILTRILDKHRAGTRFGIGMDAKDGLLRQGIEGYMLTWMDSATPRRGKAVEINALWYNALCVMAGWQKARGDAQGAARTEADAARAKASFNTRFWNPATGFLFDLVDGEDGPDFNDPACRSNQILAVSLPHPVLEPSRWAAVVAAVEARLLTPYGLRSLDPAAPDYQTSYSGGLHSRDFAYHRGTVWAWLMGPFLDAWLKVHPGQASAARRFLDGFADHMGEFCVGTVAEVFDGAPPHTPRGCTAQAWSVAEWLRAWVLTGEAKAG
ncbi:MAG: glycogen debranching enzyme family protein [Magnetospirillum sp.]|nr:glycogen debranching enzyme family protein [Magnetospirillum sp.]